MKSWPILLLFCLLSFLVAAEEKPAADFQEPPLQLSLDDGNKTIPIEIDKPFQLEPLQAKSPLTLRIKPFRTFMIPGVSFPYQKHYTFKVEDKAECTSWQLTGTPSLIMLFRFKKSLDQNIMFSAMVAGMMAQYKKENVKSSEATIELGGHKLSGQMLTINLAGQTLIQELYAFTVKETVFIIMIMDKPGKDGQPSEEGVRQKKLLKEGFRLEEEKKAP
jgi:hypothetical protein